MIIFITSGFSIPGFAQCPNCGSNLVTGGDFEMPCTSPMPFTSGMTGDCSNNYDLIENTHNGVYRILHSFSQFPNLSPHNGNQFFLGDGPWPSGNPVVAWSETINVVAGRLYTFSFWAERNDALGGLEGYILDASSNVLASVAVTLPNTDQWQQFCTQWASTYTGTVTLSIKITPTTVSGILWGNNDFGLDDITFQEQLTTSTLICYGGSTTLSANGGPDTYSYLWNTGATTQQITVSPASTTQYSVIITDVVTGYVSCEAYTVNVELLNVNLGPDRPVCPTANITISPTITNGTGPYSYSWSTGSTSSSIPVNLTGDYSVTVTDANGCTASDDIEITGPGCPAYVLYQNTQSLPALTTAADYIEAGYNITSGTPGNVVVTSGQNVEFRAGKKVILQPGFSVQPGGYFTADIQQCVSTLSAYISQGTVNNPSSCSSGNCYSYVLQAMPNGVGDYTYSWNTGATTQSITVTPTTSQTYFVTIHDNCLNQNVTASLAVAGLPFHGGPTYSIYPNVVTPNNDGKNDQWVLADGGKTQYAFNACHAHLEVYDRWGGRVWLLDTYAGPTGFAQGQIYWSAQVDDDVYYSYLILDNCDQSVTYSDMAIEVIGSVYRKAANNKSVNNSNTASGTDIYPNPTTGIVNIDFNYAQSGEVTVQVLDILGKEVFTQSLGTMQKGKTTVDLSAEPSGVYIVQITSGGNVTTQKVVLAK